MYELAFRLNQYQDAYGLEKQVKHLLAAKTALHLCEEQYAYIVMPVEQVVEKIIKMPVLVGSNQERETVSWKKTVDIIDLPKLNKEVFFATSKLKLVRFSGDRSLNITSALLIFVFRKIDFCVLAPNELVVLLNASGLFKIALQVAKTFDLSYCCIFDALTRRCGGLAEHNDQMAWRWLMENDLQGRNRVFYSFL